MRLRFFGDKIRLIGLHFFLKMIYKIQSQKMKTRIGILGIGGVGGYFGGLLAKKYHNDDLVEIVFIARGETQKTIAKNGLTIISDQNETQVFPSIVSDDPAEIGVLDYLICATKTYHIESSLTSIKTCIFPNTIILPLYNGVDATDRIQQLFPRNRVLQACVYIVSMISAPGKINKVGPFESLFFGSQKYEIQDFIPLQKILENANIQSQLVQNIEETIWEKFVFIATLASATTYFNQNIGEILSKNIDFFTQLLNEILHLAKAKNINLPENILEQTIQKLKIAPQEATSSMHRDFLNNQSIELQSLTQYVVNQGLIYQIKTPNFDLVFEKLKNYKNGY